MEEDWEGMVGWFRAERRAGIVMPVRVRERPVEAALRVVLVRKRGFVRSGIVVPWWCWCRGW